MAWILWTDLMVEQGDMPCPFGHCIYRTRNLHVNDAFDFLRVTSHCVQDRSGRLQEGPQLCFLVLVNGYNTMQLAHCLNKFHESLGGPTGQYRR